MTNAKQVLADATSEAEFQTYVVDLAMTMKWRVWHPYDSRRSVPGWPDLVLVRDRVLFVELKTTKGRVTPEQGSWLAALRVAGAYAEVWRPGMEDSIEAILSARACYPDDKTKEHQ